ncbi:hypothetical protein HYU40_04315 [Candidatus Woesearchaeota archaeon]|nr:hypothetical protein [Candidatus Woesearchaeota archaeon]
MPTDYRLATEAIGRAMKSAANGIDYLVGGDYKSAFAFAGIGSGLEAEPSRELYSGKGGERPSIDAYISASDNSTKPITNIPTAKEVLYRLSNL